MDGKLKQAIIDFYLKNTFIIKAESIIYLGYDKYNYSYNTNRLKNHKLIGLFDVKNLPDLYLNHLTEYYINNFCFNYIMMDFVAFEYYLKTLEGLPDHWEPTKNVYFPQLILNESDLRKFRALL